MPTVIWIVISKMLTVDSNERDTSMKFEERLVRRLKRIAPLLTVSPYGQPAAGHKPDTDTVNQKVGDDTAPSTSQKD